ncbi:hypothetical protein EVAR_101254_1 [Eumeta japonica]|uniref:Uncharacterized protein n=1 Tax=Eumeta variegata TaxID=151549 RepID=A0A4C1SR85_EUMVA|nr:hypothetical protein EVAR_101254_1 [Eumeta japonica]
MLIKRACISQYVSPQTKSDHLYAAGQLPAYPAAPATVFSRIMPVWHNNDIGPIGRPGPPYRVAVPVQDDDAQNVIASPSSGIGTRSAIPCSGVQRRSSARVSDNG